MPLVVNTKKDPSQLASPTAPATSRLFSELLDLNHDAWRVSRNNGKWFFYREVGGGLSSSPQGSVVITSEIGKPQTLDFYSAKTKRSLLNTYADEVPRALRILIEREHIISLFTKLARGLDSTNWDNNLTFCGVNVVERRVSLRVGTHPYARLIGDAKSWMNGPALENTFSSQLRNPPGIVVFQREHKAPYVQCAISYPRAIEANFFSSRLMKGLDAVTEPIVSLVVKHNRNLEERYRDTEDGAYF